MASKYGNQLYGADLYSSALAQLAGDLSFSVSLAAPLTNLRTYIGAVSFTVGLAGTFTDLKTYIGNITIPWTFSAVLLDINNFTGDILVPWTLTGDLFRAATRFLVGDLPIVIDLAARFTVVEELSAGALVVPIDIGGGDDIYLGPFWKPDEPVEDTWVPDVPVDAGWASSAPERYGANDG